MFKQKNILVSDIINKKILWLTETKSTIIKSTKLSKLGNPVCIIKDYALKQYYFSWFILKNNSSLQLYCKPSIKQSIDEVSRGQDWYQDNFRYLNYHAYRLCNVYRLQSYNYLTFRFYSSYINKPAKNKKLTKDIYIRIKEGK